MSRSTVIILSPNQEALRAQATTDSTVASDSCRMRAAEGSCLPEDGTSRLHSLNDDDNYPTNHYDRQADNNDQETKPATREIFERYSSEHQVNRSPVGWGLLAKVGEL